MPSDDNPADRPSQGSAESPDQLELFEPPVPARSTPDGIGRSIARACVSPGWWPLIRSLFDRADIVVHQCHEEDGRLILDAIVLEGEGSYSVEPMLQRIRDLAARTCGCCGGRQAGAYRGHVDGPTRVVCSTCRQRLTSGEEYVAIADDFWRFDGEPRAGSPMGNASAGRIVRVATASAKRQCTVLPADELRSVIAAFRTAMSAEIIGQEDAVARLALLAGLHVGGGLPRGGRALVLGPSGVGKSGSMAALRRAVEDGGWDIAWLATDCLDLTSPGWGGAPSIGDLLEAAFEGTPPQSPRARHAVVILDELHHAALVPGVEGNMDAKKREVLSSLLGMAGHGTVHLGDGTTEWSSQQALVIGMGAFTGLLDLTRPPTTADIVRAGIPLELCTRLTEELILLRPLPERELRALLRRWPALSGLAAVCERLGFPVRVHEEAVARAARAVTLGLEGATARTAGGWLVSALRRALCDALSENEVRELVVTPDSLPIARESPRRRPPDDLPDADGWDATIILTPR